VTVLAAGRTVEGDRWELSVAPSPLGLTASVAVTSVAGHRYWGTGCGLTGPLATGPSVMTTGSDDSGPATLLLQVPADVRAVVVRLSDGTREDLVLHPLPGRPDRLAVLVFPRHLDVHRIDRHDATGALLPD
jgi:hypothetical protein